MVGTRIALKKEGRMAKRKFKDFSAVIDLWTSRETLAHRLTLPSNTIRRWAYANSIPPEYWRALCAVSKGRVRLDDLFELVERKAKRLPQINDAPARSQREFASP
jgi:hypothetical protein